MQYLFIITARGGSKGVPGKNIKPLGGKPLIHYSIDAARTVVPDDQICVSTDDPAIKAVVEDYGLRVPFFAAGRFGYRWSRKLRGVAPRLGSLCSTR